MSELIPAVRSNPRPNFSAGTPNISAAASVSVISKARHNNIKKKQRREQKREMAPRKRKATDGDEEQAKAPGQETLKRVTRRMTRQADGNSSELTQPNKEKPKARAKAKASAKEKKESVEKVEEAVIVEEEEAKGKAASKDLTVADDGSHKKTVVVEHCKQCNSFKTRAFQVRDGLEKGVPGIRVLLNPEKPRRGCFEIREEGGETFISLLDMKRPFKPMKDLDMEKVISDIIDKIK